MKSNINKKRHQRGLKGRAKGIKSKVSKQAKLPRRHILHSSVRINFCCSYT